MSVRFSFPLLTGLLALPVLAAMPGPALARDVVLGTAGHSVPDTFLHRVPGSYSPGTILRGAAGGNSISAGSVVTTRPEASPRADRTAGIVVQSVQPGPDSPLETGLPAARGGSSGGQHGSVRGVVQPGASLLPADVRAVSRSNLPSAR